jgi:outer membrane protein assembly factor BamB
MHRLAYLLNTIAFAIAFAIAFVIATACGGNDSALASATGKSDSVAQAPAGPETVVTSTHDWTRFGWDAARSSAAMVNMGIDSANVSSMRRQTVKIDGTVDASPIYLHGVQVGGAAHDALFVTTTYGKTLAIDARDGTVLWRFTPPGYDSFAGTARITTATPVADPDRQFIYAAAPDGAIRKLAVADGRVAWTTSITLLPTREKIASSLNFHRGHVIAVTGGYIGDAPPYQGHVALLDAANGQLLHVWNSLCSDRSGLMVPSSCAQSDAAIWGRAGAVVDTATGNIFVATGNAQWDGATNWGDATVELSSDATRVVGNYTPSNTAALNVSDADLGSTSPVLLGNGLVVQGGKDGKIRLLDWSQLAGGAPHIGSGEAQIVSTPSGDRLFTAPAVVQLANTTWLFAADNGGTTAWTVTGRRLQQMWHNGTGGTSPVYAGGLLYVYSPGGGVHVYEPASGRQITVLASGGGHWNSPIVIDGLVALPEGNANDHATSGVLNLYRVP